MHYVISLLAAFQACYCLNRVNRNRGKAPWAVMLIYFVLVYNLVIKFIVGYTAVPSAVTYVSDAVLILILADYLFRKGFKIKDFPGSMLILGGILLGISLISLAINRYSLLLYLWGLRKNFRFLLFGMLCIVYLDKRDIDAIMEILLGFFLINILVVTYQFFTIDHNAVSFGDFISGLFSNGSKRGGNDALAWLICMVCTWQTVWFLNEGNNLWKMILCWAAGLYMAALAEIKMVMLLMVISCLLALLLCKHTKRSAALAGISAVGIILGIQLLYLIFPEFKRFFSLKGIFSYLTTSHGYAGGGIDRLTAVPFVVSNFLDHWYQVLFGIGLGNGDYSQFRFLTSAFYRNNGWTGYTYFSSAHLTLELGLVGLAGYLAWYGNDVVQMFRFRSQNTWEKSVRDLVVILGVIAILMVFANASLKMEASAYMINCVLCFGFLLLKGGEEKALK